MPMNALGNYIRERRMELGLTQEQLAERIGPTTRQAEISRLERGQVIMPRRQKMERIAAALDVSLGTLLQCSGWLTDEERDEMDAGQAEHVDGQVALHGELVELREVLQLAIERLTVLEAKVPEYS